MQENLRLCDPPRDWIMLFVVMVNVNREPPDRVVEPPATVVLPPDLDHAVCR